MNDLTLIFKTIFSACMAILNEPINIFGISINLFAVFVFVTLGSLLWWLITSILLGGGYNE